MDSVAATLGTGTVTILRRISGNRGEENSRQAGRLFLLHNQGAWGAHEAEERGKRESLTRRYPHIIFTVLRHVIIVLHVRSTWISGTSTGIPTIRHLGTENGAGPGSEFIEFIGWAGFPMREWPRVSVRFYAVYIVRINMCLMAGVASTRVFSSGV